MPKEIELKLRLQSEVFHQIPALLSHFQIEHHQSKALINTYFDSPDLAFSKQKAIVRVRECDNRFTLTAKLKGSVTGGLHSHPEFNLDLENNRPDLEKLGELFQIELSCKTEDLKPLFQTNFHRQSWLIREGKNLFELALDRGEVIANHKKEPIQELECELIEGDANAIFPFIAELFENLEGATFSATNKAQRGYALALPQEEKPFDYFNLWQEKSTAPTIEKIFSFLSIEQALIEHFCLNEKDFFANKFLNVVELLGAFFHLYEEMNEAAFFQELQSLKLSPLFGGEAVLNELATLNQIAKNELQEIISDHSQQKDNEKALDGLKSWLFSNDQLQRLLRLTAIVHFQEV